jgi:hypothetical protein
MPAGSVSGRHLCAWSRVLLTASQTNGARSSRTVATSARYSTSSTRTCSSLTRDSRCRCCGASAMRWQKSVVPLVHGLSDTAADAGHRQKQGHGHPPHGRHLGGDGLTASQICSSILHSEHVPGLWFGFRANEGDHAADVEQMRGRTRWRSSTHSSTLTTSCCTRPRGRRCRYRWTS